MSQSATVLAVEVVAEISEVFHIPRYITQTMKAEVFLGHKEGWRPVHVKRITRNEDGTATLTCSVNSRERKFHFPETNFRPYDRKRWQ